MTAETPLGFPGTVRQEDWEGRPGTGRDTERLMCISSEEAPAAAGPVQAHGP